jgi:hypothetical protein
LKLSDDLANLWPTRLVRGTSDKFAGSLESMKPGVTTKYCFISALLYVILHTNSTYILFAGLLITMKAGPISAVPVDVFQLVEEKLSPLVFGLKEKPIEKQE